MTLGTFPFSTADKKVRVIASGSLTNLPYLEITGLSKYDFLQLRFHDLTFNTSPGNGDYRMILNNNTTGVYEYIHALDKPSQSESNYAISSNFLAVTQQSYQPGKGNGNNFWIYTFSNCRQPGYTTIHSLGLYLERNENQVANIKLQGTFKVEEPIDAIKLFTTVNYPFTSGNYELIGG
jgi:hypothetical protein